MTTVRPSKPLPQAEVERVYSLLSIRTWGDAERFAGVTNRHEFWQGKTESQAQHELRSMTYDLIRRGELSITE